MTLSSSANKTSQSHNHDHDHDHQHSDTQVHDHHAPIAGPDNAKRLLVVFCLTAGYTIIQMIGGAISGSLALIADAGHMVSDAAALLLALIAYKIAARAPDESHTYGYHRVRVLAALANGVALLALVLWILIEAISRINSPAPILAGPMLAVAVVGLLVNIVGAVVLTRGAAEDANVRGAYLHVLGDLLGSVGAIVAAIGIMLFGWMWLDPLLSVLVAVLIVRSAWRLVREAIAVLLQTMPSRLEFQKIRAALLTLPEIEEVSHFHAWTLTDDRVIATLHVTARDPAQAIAIPPKVQACLTEQFGISHATVQVDPPSQIEAHSDQ